jgi:hypothetical protein
MKKGWLILLLLPVVICAQEKEGKGKGKELNLRTITSVGIVGGEDGTKPVAQFSAGVMYRNIFAGAGIGMDYYMFNSVPLFADLRYTFGPKKLLFVYTNGGYHFTGNRTIEQEFSKTTDRLKGGLYVDGGLGFRIPSGRLHRFAFSAGFSRKSMVNTIGTTMCPFVGPCFETLSKYKYTFSRITSKLSWEFGR